MAETSSLFPITKENLEKYEQDVDARMRSIRIDTRTRGDLDGLIKELKIDDEWTKCDDAMRKGFGLYFNMYDLLEKRIATEKIDGDIPDSEKRAFLGAYSTFSAASFIEHRLGRILQGEVMEYPRPKSFSFDFSQTQNDVLNDFLALHYSITKFRKEKDLVKNGQDLARSSIDFFKYLREQSLSNKSSFNNRLVDLVSKTEFRVMDEFTISGFEARIEEIGKQSKIEFVKVYPKEVVGNVSAKRKVIRYMDRLSLYDPKAKNNPCMVLGGLSWTNLWDGIPGTGKTTMIRMAMTRLGELSQQIGIKYKIHAIDQSVKSEFYGKTGQNAIAEFNSTRDPNFLHLTVLDDLDLLTQGSRQDSGGADNDLRNVIMQFLDGAFTLRIGNNQVYAASNDPKGLDGAVRNRFNDRILVEGPVTSEDFADMMVILSKQLRNSKLFNVETGYTPFETQDDFVKGRWTKPDELIYSVDPEFAKRYGKATVRDFGQYLFDLKKANPSISGRSAKAIIDAIKERSANFDVPPEFYENPEVYRNQEFERKVDMLRELYVPVQPEMLFEEAQRYAESEARYTKGEEEREVSRGYNARVWGLMAEIKALKACPELYGEFEARKAIYLQNKRVKDEIKRRIEGDKD